MKLVLAAAVAVLVSSSLLLACKHETVSTPALTSAPAPITIATAPETAPAPPTTGTSGAEELPPEPAAASTASAPSDPHACLEVDSSFSGRPAVLSGTIYVDSEFEHPSRGKTRPFILRLDAPRCVIAEGHEEPRATEVHLAPTDGASLKSLVGKHVRVSGEPFVAHTAWHARGIVVLTGNVKPAS